MSPLEMALWFICPNSEDTIRLLWPVCNAIADFGDAYSMKYYHSIDLQSNDDQIEWIMMYARSMLDGSELISFRTMVLQRILLNEACCLVDRGMITENLLQMIDAEILRHYIQGGFSLLEPLFAYRDSSIDSQSLGNIFIDLLIHFGLNVEACIAMELESLPGAWKFDPKRITIFERLGAEDWSLRWEWDLDSHDPGYLLVSEHIGLGPDTREDWGVCVWPFSIPYAGLGYYEVLCQRSRPNQPRFNRRMANKARKERARTGQKRTKSRMPGAWN